MSPTQESMMRNIGGGVMGVGGGGVGLPSIQVSPCPILDNFRKNKRQLVWEGSRDFSVCGPQKDTFDLP